MNTKPWFPLVLGLTFSVGLAGCDSSSAPSTSASAVAVSSIEPTKGGLDPADLGIYKFVYEAMLPPGKVMVLRWTTHRPGQKPAVREIIHANSYRPAREVVLIYNPNLFPFNSEPDKPLPILLKAGGEQHRSEPGASCTVSQSSEEPLTLYFTNKERWVYQCSIEDYKVAKARISDLPPEPVNGGWGTGWKLLPAD